MKQLWTKKEEQFLIDNIKILSLKELSIQLNRTVGAVADRTSRILKIYRPSLEENKPQITEYFGDLQVTSLKSLKGREYVECRCACGTKCDVRIYSLRNGNTTTCGCGLYSIRKRGGQGHTTYFWGFQIYKRNAKKQKRTFELTIKEFKDIVTLNCHYCGAEPKIVNRYLDSNGNQKHKHKQYQKSTVEMAYAKMNGIDRVDNEKGYVSTNVVPCCYVCNRAKHSMTYKEFKLWIKNLISFYSF